MQHISVELEQMAQGKQQQVVPDCGYTVSLAASLKPSYSPATLSSWFVPQICHARLCKQPSAPSFLGVSQGAAAGAKAFSSCGRRKWCLAGPAKPLPAPSSVAVGDTHTFLNTFSSYLCGICYSTAHEMGCRPLPAKHHDTDASNTFGRCCCIQRKSESS